MPDAFPSSLNKKLIPAPDSARLIASRLLAIGALFPPSKSRIVESETLARFARSVWLQSSQARAARHCSGVSMNHEYGQNLFLSTSPIFVDNTKISHYVLSTQKLCRSKTWHSISYFRQQLGPCPCALFIRAAKTRHTRRFAGCAGPKPKASPFARAAAASMPIRSPRGASSNARLAGINSASQAARSSPAGRCPLLPCLQLS